MTADDDVVAATVERVPLRLRGLAEGVLAQARRDDRILAVLTAGSVAAGTADDHSDLDLVVVCTDAGHAEVLAGGQAFAEKVGPLLVAFTGEHVGEPRLFITLFGPEPTHVDLKFVALADLGTRVEDGLVLWERDTQVRDALAGSTASWPGTDPQWIEDRFWVWIHYVTAKIRRGELFEAVDGLGFIRSAALAPLIVAGRTPQPSGVRRIEHYAPEHMTDLTATVAGPQRADCLQAVQACVDLYQRLRVDFDVVRRTEAEEAVLRYLRT